MKPEEERARQVIERVLQRSVVQNDDNSQTHMYDLRIGTAEAPEVAIEVVGARDKDVVEILKIGLPFNLKVNGDWLIWMSKRARLNEIKKRLEPILQMAESQSLVTLRVDNELKRSRAGLHQALSALQITKIDRIQMSGSGKIILQIEARGGIFGIGAETIPSWVSEFLRHDYCKDVLYKLQHSGASKCHVFIPVDINGAPEEVEYYLMRGVEEQLPSAAPDLPPPVTDVWIVSPFFTKHGLRWDGLLWKLFES